MDAALLEMIRRALPSNLPPDIREDVEQEMALAALTGEFDLTNIAAHVPTYRIRINRLCSTTKRFVSTDADVPNTNGLRYADMLVG